MTMYFDHSSHLLLTLALTHVACGGTSASHSNDQRSSAAHTSRAPSVAAPIAPPVAVASSAPVHEPPSAKLTDENVAEAIRKIAPSRVCHFESNGRKIEVRLVGNWLTTIKTIDKKPTLVNGSPIPYGQWIRHTTSLVPDKMVFICPAHGSAVKPVGPNGWVTFSGTDEHLQAMFEVVAGPGEPGFTEFGSVPYTDLTCVPMSPEEEATELATAWRRTFRPDAEKAFAEARADRSDIVLYFRGPDCPDCARVEQGTLFWPFTRGHYSGEWAVVESPSDLSAAARPGDKSAALRARFDVRVLPTFIVYDGIGTREALRFNGYFSTKDIAAAFIRDGDGDGDCQFMRYLRP